MTGVMTTSTGALFIVGMPRSGTKLLRDLLNRHPRIRISSIETEFLPSLVQSWDSFGNLQDTGSFNSFYESMIQLPHFSYLRAENRLLSAAQWASCVRDFSPSGIFEALMRVEVGAPRGSDIIWGDKSPSYIHHVPLIRSLFPSARFIHIVRDVRDYCISINKAWGKNKFRAASRWNHGVLSARTAGQLLNDSYVEVRYEELIQRPHEVMRRLCDFLCVEFTTLMTMLSAPAENRGDTRNMALIVARNCNKFMTQMSKPECKRIESLAFDGMVAFGYPRLYVSREQRASRMSLLWWQFLDGLNLIKAGIDERGMVGSVRFHLRYFRQTRGRFSNRLVAPKGRRTRL